MKNQPNNRNLFSYTEVAPADKHTSQFRKLLDFSLDVIFSIDKEGRFVEVSAASGQVWGYTPEELKGRFYLDMVIEEDRPRALAIAAQIMSGSTFTNFHIHNTCKNGSIKPVTWSASWDFEDQLMYCVARDGTERKKAEKKAKEYEQQIFRAYKLAKAGWWEWDVNNSEYFASDELYGIFGLDQSRYPEITTEKFLSLVHPEDIARVRTDLARLLDQGGDYQDELRLIKPSGELIYISLEVQTVRDLENSVLLIRGAVKDITEQKMAELALKGSEKKLSDILENLGDGFFAVDANWTITYMNGKAERLLGRNRTFFLGRNFWEVFNDAVSLKFYPEYHRAMRENVPVHFEEYYPPLNGWFELSAYPTRDGLSVYFRNITAKKMREEEKARTTEQLRRVKENLQHVLESMSDGFYTVDRNWTIQYANERVGAMVGLTKEDYIGKNLWEAIPHLVGTKYHREFHRAFEEETFVSFEEYFSCSDMWFEVKAYPYRDLLAVYATDITQRKKNEKRLEFIARATSEVIWELDLNTEEILVSSDDLKQIFGYDIESNRLHPSFWEEKVHPEDIAEVRKSREYALKNGLDFYQSEYRLRKGDMSWADVRGRVYIIKDGQNRPTGLIGAMEDVSSEKLFKKTLMESEQTYKELFDYSPMPRIIYDRETLQILQVNDAAVELYGYSKEEFLAMTILDIRPTEDHARAKEAVLKTALGSKMHLGVWTHIKKNAERIQADVWTSTLFHKGKLTNMSTIMDITEKLRLQEELTRKEVDQQKHITEAAIEAQERERSDIGKELHDNVNQLLATAKLYIENIRYFPEQAETFVEKGTSLLQKSINEIRVLSKALVTPTINDIGFNEALLEMIDDYRELHLFEIDYKNKLCPKKVRKEVKLTAYRIIQEQINNVIKHAKASLVKVHVLMEDQYLSVLIEDDGKGFDPNVKKRGIGLSNIQNRAELFGGKMKIESAAGRGCKLEITFPV